MKVYVVWSVPDYIGISIEYIFDNEEAAIKCVNEHNSSAPSYDEWSYDEYSVYGKDY